MTHHAIEHMKYTRSAGAGSARGGARGGPQPRHVPPPVGNLVCIPMTANSNMQYEELSLGPKCVSTPLAATYSIFNESLYKATKTIFPVQNVHLLRLETPNIRAWGWICNHTDRVGIPP